MPKYLCKCGTVLDLIQSPATCEFVLVSERAIEEAGALADSDESSREQLFAILDRDGRKVYECPECKRLHVQKTARSQEFEAFRNESQG